MATAMLATAPLPGNIALVIAAAEGIRGLTKFGGKQLKGGPTGALPRVVTKASTVAAVEKTLEQAKAEWEELLR